MVETHRLVYYWPFLLILVNIILMLHGVCVISKSDGSPLPSAPCSNYDIDEGNDSDHDSPITWPPADCYSGERAACAITSGYDLDEEKDFITK